MTIVVGILCDDGVVVGSDSSATFGVGQILRTIEQPTKKTFIVGTDIIFSGTGQIGLGQRFEQVLAQLRIDPHFLNAHPIEVGRVIAQRAIQDFSSTGAPKEYGALVAFPCGATFHLCEFAVADFQPEFKTSEGLWFATMGSGQPIADPFLAFIRRTLFGESRPSVNEGVFAAIWTLTHAIALNTGGINGPPQIATLQRTGQDSNAYTARLWTSEELEEHKANVDGIEQHLRGYRQTLSGNTASTWIATATTPATPSAPPMPEPPKPDSEDKAQP